MEKKVQFNIFKKKITTTWKTIQISKVAAQTEQAEVMAESLDFGPVTIHWIELRIPIRYSAK